VGRVKTVVTNRFRKMFRSHIHRTVIRKSSTGGGDVVETVTSEIETWLKFRDETETLS